MRLRARRDDGQVLPMVLVIMFIFSILVGLLLTSAVANLRMTRVNQSTSRIQYAGDGAIESAITKVRTTFNGVCPGDPTNPGAAYDLNTVPSTVALPNIPGVSSMKVTCQPIAGPRSNTFGGYSVVTGVKLPTSGGVSPQGNPNCVSLNADPLGGGHATLATGTTCLSYPPPGGANPSWLQQDSPFRADGHTANNANLNGVFALDAFNIWTVGDNIGAGGGSPAEETIWHSEGDEWDDVGTSTGAVTNKKLFGVWASDVSHVWAVGEQGSILSCTANCDDDVLASWSSLTAGSDNLNAVAGIDSTHVWAVGDNVSIPVPPGSPKGTQPTQLENIWYFDGTTWTQISTPTNTGGLKDQKLLGVWAADVNHVWAVGQSGNILYCSSACTTTAATWAVTDIGNQDLFAVDGTDSSHVWAVGKAPGAAGGNLDTILMFNGAAWAQQATPADNKNLNGVGVADAQNVFAVGDGGNAYSSNPTWASLSTGVGTKLAAATAVPANPGAGIALGAWAVGDGGEILFYTPPAAGASLATIEGGPVFNAGKANFVTPTRVANGDFTQFQLTNGCPSQPSNLTVSVPYAYTNPCPTTIPQSILNLPTQYHLPTSTAPFNCVGATVTCTQQNANGFASLTCPGGTKVAIFAPGYYQTHPNLKQAGFSTYFFESGVYYFKTGNWGGIGDDKNAPWVIGGAPSSTDTPTIAPNSPCWSTITGSAYYSNPSASSPGGNWVTGGTGVEWILGAGTWLDVHSVHLEIFTREAPTDAQAQIEGAQGISIREVSPGSSPAGWATSNPGGKLQLVQVDANNHNPEFYLHGGIYSPNNNVEFFTNKLQVTTGPILANSLELAFATSASPPLKINAGGDGKGQYQFVATGTTDGSNGLPKGSLQVEAVVTFDRKTAGVPITIQSWRVRCTPTGGNSLGNC